MRSAGQIVASLYDEHAHDDRVAVTDLFCVSCADELRLTGTTLSVGDSRGLVAVVGASGAEARALEERQLELGEGPSVDAARSGEPAVHGRLDHTSLEQWPGFAASALDAGVGAVAALPLSVMALSVGVMGMYDTEPGRWRSSTLTAARTWADAAVVVLLDLQRAGPDPGVLASSVAHNAEVHQATGFVSVTAGVTIDEALALLRAAAYSSGVPLLQLCRDVLAERVVIDRPGGHDG